MWLHAWLQRDKQGISWRFPASIQVIVMPLNRLRLLPACLALLLAGMLAGCGADDDVGDDYVERPVEQLYNQAFDTALSGDYTAAAPMFDEVERQHPYSVWATKARLMAAYSLYQSNRYNEAVAALDRFIELNPAHRDVSYAYYLKGLCFYEQIIDVGRDQALTMRALETFTEVVKRFPGSKYARDASLKIDLTRNHLAGKEMAIGRFYQRRGHFLAAINRYRFVVNEYQTTEQVPEALHRLTESYLALGLDGEARKAAAVLGYNYPGSRWYQDSYALLGAEGSGERNAGSN